MSADPFKREPSKSDPSKSDPSKSFSSPSNAQGSSAYSGPLGQPSGQPSVARAAESLKDNVGDALDRGKSGIADSASAARDSLADDLSKLRADVASMQQTLSKLASRAGGEAMQTARNVASEVGAATSNLFEAGKEQAKTVSSELEGMARRNPLGTLAGTLVVGILIGMISLRGRS